MKEINLLGITMMLAFSMMFASCSDDKEEVAEIVEPISQLDKTISEMEGMVALESSMLDATWDEGYVSSDGYVLAKGLNTEHTPIKSLSVNEEGDSSTPCISVLSTDRSTLVYLFFSEDGLPSQLIIGKNILYFNFLNDEVLELSLSNGSEYRYITTVEYNKEEMLSAINDKDYSYIFQTRLALVVYLLENADIPAEYKFIVEIFKVLCYKQLSQNPDSTLQDLIDNGLLDENGNADFIDDVTDTFLDVEVNVRYSIVLWTGKASFKVGGTSCTLSGTIHCASPSFNEYGTYGIVCDTDPSKLSVDYAEYKGRGYQEGISTHFDVDFRGLKANTTYYYRAYYKFNNSNHGELNFKYGDPNAEIAYDTVIKEFTTGDNRLSVDVVMCIDVTGSMSGIISTVKRNALSFYESFNNKCINNGIQLEALNNKVIAFQDINVDGDDWWKESEFFSLPTQLTEFNSFVNNLYTGYGGDTPESGLEALMGAFNALEGAVDDGYHRQVVILWTDAPYLSTPEYTSYTPEMVMSKWNTLSSGRRLILFAPDYTYDYNGGNWSVFDGQKNVIHSTSLSTSFSDFDYILDSIIEELTGKGETEVTAKSSRPNFIKIHTNNNN